MNPQAGSLFLGATKHRRALLLILHRDKSLLALALVPAQPSRVPMTLPVLAVPSSQVAFSLLLKPNAG